MNIMAPDDSAIGQLQGAGIAVAVNLYSTGVRHGNPARPRVRHPVRDRTDRGEFPGRAAARSAPHRGAESGSLHLAFHEYDLRARSELLGAILTAVTQAIRPRGRKIASDMAIQYRR